MGGLGLSLVFVGIVLVANGACTLCKVDAKSMSFLNVATGLILTVLNIIAMVKAESTADYQGCTAGLLFGLTYLFIAANLLFKLDGRPFGWFCLFVSVFAVVSAIATYRVGDWKSGSLWAAWAILWFEGFLEAGVRIKAMGKVYPFLAIAEGVLAAFIPAMLILFGIW